MSEQWRCKGCGVTGPPEPGQTWHWKVTPDWKAKVTCGPVVRVGETPHQCVPECEPPDSHIASETPAQEPKHDCGMCIREDGRTDWERGKRGVEIPEPTEGGMDAVFTAEYGNHPNLKHSEIDGRETTLYIKFKRLWSAISEPWERKNAKLERENEKLKKENEEYKAHESWEEATDRE